MASGKRHQRIGLHRISKLRHLDLHADCGGFRTGAWCSADNKNRKKPLFTFFMMMGVLGCAALAIPRT